MINLRQNHLAGILFALLFLFFLAPACSSENSTPSESDVSPVQDADTTVAEPFTDVPPVAASASSTPIPTLAAPTEEFAVFEVQTPTAETASPFAPEVEVKKPEDVPANSTSPTKLYESKTEDIDRSCPNPPPAAIDYYHYYLSGDQWPEPDSRSDEHFWLTSPFEGGQRLLITTWFPYGYDAGGRYLIHNGIDMAEPLGTPLLAAASGTIVAAGDDLDRLFGWRCNWYGHLVIIELDDRWDDQPVFVLYGHVLNIIVEEGQRVERGQPLAEVGFGGAAASPHLHLEVRLGDNTFAGTRNPLLWIAPSENKGLIVGRLVDPEGRPWQGAAVTATGVSEGTQNYTSWTYLGDPELIVNPDDRYAENFVIGDITPGTYEITAAIQGEVYRAEIIVESGAVTTVELVTKPYKTPTPAPPAETAEPEQASL